MNNDAGKLIALTQQMKVIREYFDDFQRQHPKAKWASECRKYSAKLNWIMNDMLVNPLFDQNVRDLIRKEIDIDPLLNLAIMEKISQIKPEQRHHIEDLLDTILSGAELQVELKQEG